MEDADSPKRQLLKGEAERAAALGPAPWDLVSFVSRVFFLYLGPLLTTGYKRPLTVADVWPTPRAYSCVHGAARLSDEWDRECRLRPDAPSAFRALLSCALVEAPRAACCSLLAQGLVIGGVQCARAD